MLTKCQYCHERVNPARLQLHLKHCLQYRRSLRKQIIAEKTEGLTILQDEQKPKQKRSKK